MQAQVRYDDRLGESRGQETWISAADQHACAQGIRGFLVFQLSHEREGEVQGSSRSAAGRQVAVDDDPVLAAFSAIESILESRVAGGSASLQHSRGSENDRLNFP